MRPRSLYQDLILLLCLGAFAASVSSCDFMDAMSATKTMPDKIDQTNEQVSETNRKMDSTNAAIRETNHNMVDMEAELVAMRAVMEAMSGALDEMRQLLDQMRQSMAQMQSSMGSLNDKMDKTIQAIAETNRKMEKVNSAIHKQTLVAALTEMMKPENTAYLFPPTGMMPAGQTFAEEATSNEIVQMIYVTLKDIDEVQPDSAPSRSRQTPEEMDHDKLAKFTSLEVIAGLMPQTSVEEAVTTEINNGGRYDMTVYQLLMLRTLFIKSILIEEDLFAGKLDDLGKIQEAITRVTQLDWIVRLPFAAQIGVKTRGMIDPDDNVDERVDLRMTVPMWDRLARALDTELDPAKVGTSPEALAKVQEFKTLVKSYQDSWHS
jgi:hypothetical protein